MVRVEGERHSGTHDVYEREKDELEGGQLMEEESARQVIISQHKLPVYNVNKFPSLEGQVGVVVIDSMRACCPYLLGR